MSPPGTDPLDIAVRALDERFELDPDAPRLRIVVERGERAVEACDRRSGQPFRRIPADEILALYSRIEALNERLRHVA